MKLKINTNLLFALSISVLVLASCSSNSGLTVSKRHYRSGYEIAWKSNKKADKKQVLQQQKQEDMALIQQYEINNNSVTAIAECNSDYKSNATLQPITNTKVTAPSKTKSIKTVLNSDTYNSYSNDVTASEKVSSEKEKTITTKQEKKKGFFKSMFRSGGGDMPKWAEIILCIILPPLPVGLRFGIGSQFWISLVLTLLFWIPGVVYALIICNS